MSLLNSRYLTAVQRYDDEGIRPSVVRSRCVGRIVTSLICCRKCASCLPVCCCVRVLAHFGRIRRGSRLGQSQVGHCRHDGIVALMESRQG